MKRTSRCIVRGCEEESKVPYYPLRLDTLAHKVAWGAAVHPRHDSCRSEGRANCFYRGFQHIDNLGVGPEASTGVENIRRLLMMQHLY